MVPVFKNRILVGFVPQMNLSSRCPSPSCKSEIWLSDELLVDWIEGKNVQAFCPNCRKGAIHRFGNGNHETTLEFFDPWAHKRVWAGSGFY